ncbi:hypothetical protein [Streptomyces guryensis]|uniref:Uncharacterized protein n=1 Tax=Streptomyces guryensis TaxID=2886947 RepID=A0A9Q3VSP8_9ACTN|nr:hypothetical protein [Streptomyces guryensis]MCD9876280.1 hypothetical protein [Streptomyces guryensis]
MRHELASGAAKLAGTVAGTAVAVGTREGRQWSTADTQNAAIVAVAFLVIAALVRSTRFGHRRDFESAGPLPDPGLASGGGETAVRSVFLFVLAAGLVYVWSDIWVFVLLVASDYLAKAAVGGLWQRRHGKLLWRVSDEDGERQLAYSPLTPPPPTRTATDAPPA